MYLLFVGGRVRSNVISELFLSGLFARDFHIKQTA